jgi:iron(III) transport system ATP-binding protein
VRKAFGGVAAVAGVDLDVGEHELVALVGPSGCGKSTLLRLVAGLADADAGEIRIGGEVVDDGVRRVEPEHRRTGLVFQEHALFPHLSVADNITFGLRRAGRGERAQRAAHWLGVIGLAGHGSRYPHELSGGERQRVALARALAPEPRLVLLDEPFASLDPNLRARLRTDIVEVLRSTGTPALFVTHDQAEALSVGDRVAVMRAGRIEQDAPPDDVYHRPVNRFVAAFMSAATFLPVTDGRTELGPCEGRDGTLLVVRPQDIALAADVNTDAGVLATVLAAEFHGATRTYRVALPSGTELLATVPHTVHTAVGSAVGVTLRPGDHATVPDDATPLPDLPVG